MIGRDRKFLQRAALVDVAAATFRPCFGRSIYPLSIADGESMDEQLGQPLDGLELDYTYEGGGQIIASFSHGRLKYRWLSGPFEGVEETGLNYQISARSR